MKRLKNLLGLARRKPIVGVTPADVVHRENKWTLLRYRPPGSAERKLRYRTPVLLVPSLINRHYVLDLMPGKSFAEYLVQQGHDVFIIDWGTPGPEDRYLSFDAICDRYLGRAVRKTCKIAGTKQAHLLGYCLGGTLTTIYAAARPEHVASMVALAAPIDFHDDGLLSYWMQRGFFDIDAIAEAFGNIPWPLMQASFHLLKPTLNLVKGVTLVDRAWDDQFLDGFLAIEKWGNDNVSFPGEAYRRYIADLYQGNQLVRGEFHLSDRPARLSSIDCPVLCVTFKEDHIVPWKSAAVLLDQIASTDKEHLDLRGGHVGAVVSRRASESLWPALHRWWAERDERGDDRWTPSEPNESTSVRDRSAPASSPPRSWSSPGARPEPRAGRPAHRAE